MPKSPQPSTSHPYHLSSDELPWTDYSDSYPEDMMKGMRAKRLIGPGGAMHDDETLMGVLEIDPGVEYPAHRHPAPEVYYVIEGEAECTWGDETFQVGPGSVIRTPPGEWHAIRNTGTGRFFAVAYWWAPGGDREILAGRLELSEKA
jgi:quercetin dioxygenase-like cupin family protein